MARIKIRAGDFITISPSHSYGGRNFHLATEAREWKLKNTETIPVTELEYVELASEENVKKLGGTIGWGAAGAALLGPAGLLAGLLLGGKKKEVTFIAKFRDGRKFIGTTDPKTWADIQGGALHLL
jgi:hypothetical protein